MRSSAISCFLYLVCFSCSAQFAPPAGQVGTTAMYKDSSSFVAWATGCNVVRGYENISNPLLGYASAGDSSLALGIADGSTVSFGDSGYAILTFARPIINGPGPDFAIFENSFDGKFLELGFVEVSSDGINYFRFPATSNTQDTSQVVSFGDLDATKLNNLAGKYQVLYGTPFDLEELLGTPGLDVNNITHVKIIDVIGCIQDAYATHDQNNNKINDPWPTAFATGGFDLDALGVINQAPEGIQSYSAPVSLCTIFPNPMHNHCVLQYNLAISSHVEITINDLTGRALVSVINTEQSKGWQTLNLNNIDLSSGIYLINVITPSGITTKKIIVSND
jgi:hypothetical protein